MVLLLQDQGVLENFFEERCNQSIFFLIFVSVTVGYKFILHAIALTLACLIRKIKVTVLNDSRETVAIIYGSTLMLVVATLVIMTLNQSSDSYNVMWTIVVFFVSMIYIGLTYIPKVCLIVQ